MGKNDNQTYNKLYAKVLKSILDLFFAILFVLLFWWIYVICGFAVFLSSGSPVFFKQIRVGKDGKQFKILKYRTMINGADKIGSTSTLTNDSRITKIGNILRKTSLDELPQIFNIILGQMSFVGFRPDVPHDNDDYTNDKYRVKPGITGLAQVNGRSSLKPEEKLYYENKYPKIISLKEDVLIIVKTVVSVLKRSGTN